MTPTDPAILLLIPALALLFAIGGYIVERFPNASDRLLRRVFGEDVRA